MKEFTHEELDMMFNALFEQKYRQEEKGVALNEEREALLKKIFKMQMEEEKNESR